MERKDDLEHHICGSSNLIHEYKAIMQISSDLEDKTRVRRVIRE